MTNEINKAIEILKVGGVILYPTDTIWGIGCDATNENAVAKIYEIKKRNDAKSMIILLDNLNKIYSYSDAVPDIALDIIEMANNPTTVIFSEAKNLAKNLINKDGSIAIRVAQDEFCKKLIQRFKKPIVSTSANVSGEFSPQNFSEISEEIKNNVDFITNLFHNKKEKNKPSGIIKVGKNNEISIIRE